MSVHAGVAEAVYVVTPARLHLGIFDLPGGGFGGLGVAVRAPQVELVARRADAVTAAGPQAARAQSAAQRFFAHWGIASGAHLTVRSAIPPHVGLGSGTQMDLAVCYALAQLYGLPADPRDLAAIAGRAGRSKVGLESFRQGGFVIYAALDGTRPELRVVPFPEEWALIVVIPTGRQGLSGQAEESAFAARAPMGAREIAAIHAALREQVIPGLIQRDLARFGAGIMAIQERVGDHFAPFQGGRYSYPLAPLLVGAMRDAGAACVAQSSWGPALCAVTPAAAAEAVRDAVHQALAGRDEVRVLITRADNQGARWGWLPCT